MLLLHMNKQPLMNSHIHESHFGPPSELIDIAKFIKSAVDLGSCDVFSFAAEEHETPGDVVAECRRAHRLYYRLPIN